MTQPSATAERLAVALGPRSYDIVVGAGLIAEAGALIKPHLRGTKAMVVTDDNVAAHVLPTFIASLTGAGIEAPVIVLEPGETTKDFAHLERVVTGMLEQGVDRKTAVIALGGGVIGDLTGVAAALTLRGLDFIQVPTTLLAQVDSSVGGKTAINTAQGKNLVGAFYQPRLVLADTAVLDSLPPRELLAGYAEVVKYGAIDMPDFFDWLENSGAAVLAGDPAARRQAILTCCRAKARIVAADETEQGQRALLNLGHTFGHALEAEAGYEGALLHGEAVAIGMVMALTLSNRMGLCPGNDAARLAAHLRRAGMAADLSGLDTRGWTADRLLAHMQKDKKTEGGKLTFILCHALGRAFIAKDVPPEPVKAVLEEFLGG